MGLAGFGGAGPEGPPNVTEGAGQALHQPDVYPLFIFHPRDLYYNNSDLRPPSAVRVAPLDATLRKLPAAAARAHPAGVRATRDAAPMLLARAALGSGQEQLASHARQAQGQGEQRQRRARRWRRRAGASGPGR